MVHFVCDFQLLKGDELIWQRFTILLFNIRYTVQLSVSARRLYFVSSMRKLLTSCTRLQDDGVETTVVGASTQGIDHSNITQNHLAFGIQLAQWLKTITHLLWNTAIAFTNCCRRMSNSFPWFKASEAFLHHYDSFATLEKLLCLLYVQQWWIHWTSNVSW